MYKATHDVLGALCAYFGRYFFTHSWFLHTRQVLPPMLGDSEGIPCLPGAHSTQPPLSLQTYPPGRPFVTKENESTVFPSPPLEQGTTRQEVGFFRRQVGLFFFSSVEIYTDFWVTVDSFGKTPPTKTRLGGTEDADCSHTMEFVPSRKRTEANCKYFAAVFLLCIKLRDQLLGLYALAARLSRCTNVIFCLSFGTSASYRVTNEFIQIATCHRSQSCALSISAARKRRHDLFCACPLHGRPFCVCVCARDCTTAAYVSTEALKLPKKKGARYSGRIAKRYGH